jgi:hypothetical protein
MMPYVHTTEWDENISKDKEFITEGEMQRNTGMKNHVCISFIYLSVHGMLGAFIGQVHLKR